MQLAVHNLIFDKSYVKRFEAGKGKGRRKPSQILQHPNIESSDFKFMSIKPYLGTFTTEIPPLTSARILVFESRIRRTYSRL